MNRVAPGLVTCALLCGIGASSVADRAAELRQGLLLYAAPGLPDPNFANTVVLLVEHGAQGSMGLVVNQSTDMSVEAALDLKEGTLGVDLPLYWGGPVQREAVLALVRAPRPSPLARTVVEDVQITPDLGDVKAALGGRDPHVRVRVFAGYAGWDRGQLAAEVRSGTWVLDRADAATVFSSEPSQVWKKVYEILGRVQARADGLFEMPGRVRGSGIPNT
jgi:putative transcriptional regulator